MWEALCSIPSSGRKMIREAVEKRSLSYKIYKGAKIDVRNF
jgi:hypothetical protein